MTRIAGTPAYLNASILGAPPYVTPHHGTPRQFAMPPPLATLVPMRVLAPTLSDEPLAWPSRGRIALSLAVAMFVASFTTFAMYLAQRMPEDQAVLVAGLPIRQMQRAAEALAARPIQPPVVNVDRPPQPRSVFPPRRTQRPRIQPPTDPVPFVLPSVLPPLNMPLPPRSGGGASGPRPRIRVPPPDHGF